MKRDDLRNLASELGLQFDEEAALIFGQREGYSLFLMGTGQTNQLQLFLSVKAEGADQTVVSEAGQGYGPAAGNEVLQQLEAASDLLSQFRAEGFQVSYVIKAAMTFDKTAENVKQAVQEVLDFLKAHGFKNVCQQTGQPGETAVYQISDSICILSAESYNALASSNETSLQAYDSKPENVAGGLVGALIGSLIGGAVILLVAQLGYVSMLGGMAMGFCTIKGYELLGRKLSNAGIAISVIFMILMTFIANQLDYALAFIREGLPTNNLFEAFLAVTEYVFSGEDVGNYWFNLVLLYLFTGGGAFYAIKNAVDTRKVRFVSRKL